MGAKSNSSVNRELELQILNLYRRYPQTRSFAEEVGLTAWNGVVVNTEDFFLLTRPVDIYDPEERWRDASYTYNRSRQNCWFVTIYGGISQKNPFSFVPYALPLVAWSRRDNPARIYEAVKIQKRCDLLTTRTIPSFRAS